MSKESLSRESDIQSILENDERIDYLSLISGCYISAVIMRNIQMETFWVGIEMHCEQKNSKDMKIYSAWLYPHYNIKHKDKENSSINFPFIQP